MRKLKYLFLLPLVTLVSCGYSTSYLVQGDKYVSSNFKENYYTHWDNELESAKKEQAIDISNEAYVYDYTYVAVGGSTLKDFGVIDLNYFDKDPIVDDYGDEYKMIDNDDSFRYGYQSKLFDGQLVCGAQNNKEEYAFQRGRVQIKESGFSVRFSKESNELHYFAMQFKASTDNTRPYYLVGGDEYKRQSDTALFHDSTIKLTVTLYLKNNLDIIGYPFEIEISLDEETTNDGHHYTFVAFDLEKYKTDTFAFTRLVGASVQYKVLNDELIDYNKNVKQVEDISYDDYALFLYEMFFPYTSWN